MGKKNLLSNPYLLILAITHIFGTLGVGVAPSIGVLLADDVASSTFFTGLARTASTLGAAAFGYPLALLANRFNRRIALSMGWWIAALGALLLIYCAQHADIYTLYPGLFLIGAGSAAALQARFAAADATTHDKARVLSFIVWVGTIGSVLGPNLGTPGHIIGGLFGLNTYAGAFLIASICLLIAGFLLFFFFNPQRIQENEGNTYKSTPKKKKLSSAHSRISPRVALCALIIAQSVMVSIMTMTPVFMHHNGHQYTFIGIVISIHIIGMYAFSPLVGWFISRIGVRATIALGTIILAASTILCMIPSGAESSIVSIGLFLLGFGWSFVFVAGSSAIGTMPDGPEKIRFQGFTDTSVQSSAALSALGSGFILDIFGFHGLNFIALLLLIPLAIVLIPQRSIFL